MVALGAVCTLVPIGLATVVKTGATHSWGSDRVAVAATQNALHVDEVRGCDADHGLRFDRNRRWLLHESRFDRSRWRWRGGWLLLDVWQRDGDRWRRRWLRQR